MTADAARARELPAVVLRRTYQATTKRVFHAWTDSSELQGWFVPEGMEMLGCEVDARVGGDYRISYRTPDGEVVYVVGTYLEVEPGERLVFTWTFEGTDREETLVTVEFRDRGAETEVVVIHERFVTEEFRAIHEFGWGSAMKKLFGVLGQAGADRGWTP